MPPEAVQPLRITKSNSSASPNRMPGSAIPRPLAEISPMGIRRNSPSFNQTTKALSPNRDSSPFDASPLNNSPRLYWKDRESLSPGIFDTENVPHRTASPSPTRRSSLENLMKASRVKNNNMFLREQQQGPELESSLPMNKPMAKLRPFSASLQGNVSGTSSLDNSTPGSPTKGHRRTDSTITLPMLQSQIPIASTRLESPQREPTSPQKSSLSSNSRYAITDPDDTEEGVVSDNDENASPTRTMTPRAALRQPKSVSFDVAPPHINEYERPTPEPSSLASDSREGSYDSDPFDLEETYDRRDSDEREDSFDDALEDVHQTPVVLPEDWRFMSPKAANTDLAEGFDDPFEGRQEQASPIPKARQFLQGGLSRSDSVASNGEARPLPPLPGVASREQQQSTKQAPARFGLLPSTQRLFPTPPPAPASVSKAEILKMSDKSMTLAERMRLLNVDDHNVAKTSASRERSPREESVEPLTIETSQVDTAVKAISEDSAKPLVLQGPPRISRESIMREVKSKMLSSEQEDEQDDEPSMEVYANQETYHPVLDYANLDPDVPIPSRETSSNYENEFKTTPPKSHAHNAPQVLDYNLTLPDVIFTHGAHSSTSGSSRASSVVRHDVDDEDEYDDAASVAHSETTVQNAPTQVNSKPIGAPQIESSSIAMTGGLEDGSKEVVTYEDAQSFHNRIALPDFSSFDTEDFGLSLQSYMTPTLEKAMTFEPLDRDEFDSSLSSNVPAVPAQESFANGHSSMTVAEQVVHDIFQDAAVLQERPATPDNQVIDIATTPESVIHNQSEDETTSTPTPELPEIPEPVATIRTPGGKFKTRKSATPSDMEAMALARRVVSGEPVPPIPEKHRLRPCTSYELQEAKRIQEEEIVSQSIKEEDEEEEEASANATDRRKSFDFKLDVGEDVGHGLDGFGINEEFDRVMEAQKRGYLMRQNTKVVVASNRQTSGDIDSLASKTGSLDSDKTVSTGPRKPSGKTWTTEPWNGKMRRQSTRRGSVLHVNQGPVPPLPGQESNAVEVLAEEEEYDDLNGTVERGRLFVKVIGVKNLSLPLPRNERTSFQLTLDNGLHCVTTSWLDLGKSAPIGQEFELTVFDDLEFHLTLQTKLTKPKARPMSTSVLHHQTFKPSKTSTLSRLLASPKKRREQERKQQEEDAQAMYQQEREIEALRAAKDQPTAWDLQHELVGEDGSFARAYVSLHDHEADAFGRATVFNLDCWNEWALEDKAYASTRSKLGGIQRRPPYKIGTLEVQMLYIPKPKNAKDEDMPKSMSAAVRQLKEAELKSAQQFEGFLSQQGGDCPYWRRRFFKLDGSKLTSFHETTRQRRATINLARASRLIDDRPSLTQNPSSSPTKGTSRRKSAFAEDEEGYMFVEEGFRIRFSNGEVIDFYADSAQAKDDWMRVLCEVVGKDGGGGGSDAKSSWVEAVRSRQRRTDKAPSASAGQQERRSAEDPQPRQTDTSTAGPAPSRSTIPSFAPPTAPPRRTSRSAPTSPVRGDSFFPPPSHIVAAAPPAETLEEYMKSRASARSPQRPKDKDGSGSSSNKPLPSQPSQPSLIERAREKAQAHMRHKSQPEGLGGGGIAGFMKRGGAGIDGGNGGSSNSRLDATAAAAAPSERGRGRRQMIKSMIF